MQTQKLKINNNQEIAYFAMPSDESGIGIIIVHGLAEHKGRYEEFIDKLHAMGHAVFAFDLIGHGESSGPRGDIKNFKAYVDELAEFVAHIKQTYPKLKIGLFGHSLGGLIACTYASQHQDIEFLILSNPPLERNRRLKLLHFVPYKILGFIKIKKRRSESQKMLQYSRQDPLSCKYMTLRLLGEVFIIGINNNLKNLPNIKIPVLLMIGSEDRFVTPPQNFERLIEIFGSPDKTLKIYEGLRHRLVHSAKKEEIINDISTWIKTRVR